MDPAKKKKEMDHLPLVVREMVTSVLLLVEKSDTLLEEDLFDWYDFRSCPSCERYK